MTINRILAIMVMLLGLATGLSAQNINITGKVTDSANQPIIGAFVMVEGSSTGAMTEEDGSYALSAPADATLNVSIIGYETQSEPVNGRAVINFVLLEESISLDDVIVVAFGTATKESFTGSAKVVKTEDILKSQTSNVANALVGKVAGVQMSSSSGQPGSSPEIRIRGISSLNAGNSPLWIVDGMPYGGDLSNLNPADIESMTVLKDAASNALYGARGANGVVMVTTKRARSQSAIINVDAKVGVNTRAGRDYEYITNPAMFYETHYGALKSYYLASGLGDTDAHRKAANALTGSASEGGLGYQVYTVPAGQDFIGANGKVNPYATLGRRAVYAGEEFWIQPDNWVDAAYRNSLRQEYNASVAKSSQDYNIYFSFGYLNNEGIAYNSDMERYTARVRADVNATEWMKIGVNATYAHFEYNSIDDSGADNASNNVFAYTTSIGPIYPLYIRNGDKSFKYNKDGVQLYDYGTGKNAGQERAIFPNGNALSDSRLNTQQSEGNAFNGTGFIDIKFLKDFTFTFNAGITLDETRGTQVFNPWFGQFASEKGLVSKSHSRQLEFNTQQILNWNRHFGKHNVSAMIGHEYYNAKSYSLSGAKNNMFSQANNELAGAITDKMQAGSGRAEYNNEGYFARVMYDFDSRYFVSASYRRDASSRFHPKHRWGNFWSVGGAWNMSDEAWMAPVRNWFDNLKFKASIGSQGNDNIGDFRYIDNYSIQNANGEISTVFASKGSENITWETNTNFNTGFEFGFLQSRISGGIEYFYRATTDMLLSFPVAPSMGYSSYFANVGDMGNSGFELELNFNPIRRDNVNWNINLNMTHVRNRITMLPAERRTKVVEGYEGYVSGTTFYGEGLPMYTFYMKKYAGVNEEGLSTWYKDVLDNNGNPTGERVPTTDYTEASDYLCGDPHPDVYGGFGTNIDFFGFDFGIDFTYQIGGKAYDSGYAASMYSPANKNTGMNWHKDILKAWTPENPNSDIPRLRYEDKNQNASSDRFLTDASYLGLQNISFGYTLPERASKKFYVNRLRIYLACENVWYWSHRIGFDPRQSQTGGTTAAGYSPVRTISGGLNITF